MFKKSGYKVFSSLIVLMISCTTIPKEVQQSLEMAGDNRQELEKVLEHFGNDTKKLKAAEFLIANMKYQYTQVGEGVDSLNRVYRFVYGAYDKNRGKLFLEDSIQNRISGGAGSFDDLCEVSSHFLIDQIETAFETYSRFEWCQKYPFDAFCEYILPYSMGHSDTVNWRTHVLENYGSMVEYMDFERGKRYEAENGRFEFSKLDSVSRSSGKRVVDLVPGDSSSLEIDFNIEIDRVHRILISYFNGHELGATVSISLDGKVLDTLLFPSTGSWWGWDSHRLPVELYQYLDKGIHTLKLASLDKNIFLDHLEIPDRIPFDLFDSLPVDGYYFLKNKLGALTLQQGDSIRNGVRLTIQKEGEYGWPVKLQSTGFGFYQLLFEKDSTTIHALDAYERSSDSTKVQLWHNNGGNNQTWALILKSDGGFQIRNKSTNRILTYSKEPDLIIQSSPHNNSDENQIWWLEPIKDSIEHEKEPKGDSKIVHVAKKISDFTDQFKWHNVGSTIGPIDPISVIGCKYGTCAEETRLQTMMLRALGVAATVDFVFNWAERGSGHSWSVIVATDGSIIQNNCHHDVGSSTDANGFKKGKVYRQTNHINHESLFIKNNGKEPIPIEFDDPYFKDVTSEYCQTYDFKLSIAYSGLPNNKYGYLMVRNYSDWVVTGWGERKGDKISFKDVEPDVVYLPTFYIDEGFQSFSPPFYLDSIGEVHFIKADVNNLQTLSLKRKFPNRKASELLDRRIIGGKFQGSNRKDFSDSVTIGMITTEMTDPLFHTIQVNTNQAFQYLRYIGPDGGNCNISEVIFYDIKGDTISGKIIGTPGSKGNKERTKEKAFDGNVLTYFDAPTANGGWVGLKLKQASKVAKIRFATRNDGNMIEVGNWYELVYWDRDREWVSLGKIRADKDSLVYTNVPKEALYLLHNYSKGREERIFTYEDGKQIWW